MIIFGKMYIFFVIKGIQKVGFELCGYGERTKPLGISFLGRFVFNFYEARDGSCYPKDK